MPMVTLARAPGPPPDSPAAPSLEAMGQTTHTLSGDYVGGG